MGKILLHLRYINGYVQQFQEHVMKVSNQCCPSENGIQ